MTEDTPRQTTSEEPDPKLLELLVCPVTKGPLTYDRAARELISAKANLAFPIRHGVPLMTVEAARSLDEPAAPSTATSGTTPPG
ncbi:Trm112 family protein [Hyphomicrobium sp. LHD-15]|uniref:Trm112 family protein n=1 Tax=Hyphomicrobium sp. LHD-15 TaxID=3072142 RepID=UPI00280EBDCF|nr:Trm112 family protein [Hyphomicrobium sp. LHD-15]MDQ8698566.1 Trm112 family protein [Hyphomicrobium sp. LHD-15]